MPSTLFSNNSFLLPLLILSLLILGVGVVAYNSGLPPSVLGHTSDEVSFASDFFQYVTNDCTDNAFGEVECKVSCPTNYKVAGGTCASMGGYQWTFIGSSSDGKSWSCKDETHFEYFDFMASAWCMKTG